MKPVVIGRVLRAVRLGVAALATGFMAVVSWLFLGAALETGVFHPVRDLLILGGTLGTIFVAPYALVLGLVLRAMLGRWRKEGWAIVIGPAAGLISGLLLASWVGSGFEGGPSPAGQLFAYGLFMASGAIAGLTFFCLMPPIVTRSS